MQVPTLVEPWDVKGPRRASVNSFGYGGSNAHAILEDTPGYLSSRGLQAPYRTTKSLLPTNMVTSKDDVPNGSTDSTFGLMNGSPSSQPVDGLSNGTNGFLTSSTDENRENPIERSSVHTESKHGFNGNLEAKAVQRVHHNVKSQTTRLFVLSAVDEAAGKKQAKALALYLEERAKKCDNRFLDDFAYTLNERRSKFLWKLAISAISIDDLIEKLKGEMMFSKGSKKPIVGFVFTGQGAQWCGMGRELLASYPVFRGAIEKIGVKLTSIGAPFNLLGESFFTHKQRCFCSLTNPPVARRNHKRSERLPNRTCALQPANLHCSANRSGRSLSFLGNYPGFRDRSFEW